MLIRMKDTSATSGMLALVCLAWLGRVHSSVLVPSYALPPASFGQQRDQRSLPGAQGTRTLARLAGGHLRLSPSNGTGGLPDRSKNAFAFVDKDAEGYDKFAGVIVKTENRNVGWNQGQWDDGMLMSSAGNGKEKDKDKGKRKSPDDDEDRKTLADQVAEGKYGLIQKELFSKTPDRPGVISYATNPETNAKDNESSLGGLKSDEIWLAEDHLLVLKGGSYPEHDPKPGESSATWPPIDAYQAPPRQVKIPQNPEVPPPFPVRLSDDGPLVFLTQNGSVPAPLFPARPPGAGFGPFSPSPYPGSQAPPSPAQGPHSGDAPPGGAPFPIPAFPFLPPRNESELPFPFPGSINASFPGGLPPGASLLPPPGNLSDLYDEDDPSIYYPPPYSFSYRADNASRVPAGPLVPGIVLPPPPDFFAPLERPTTTSKPTAHAYPPTPAAPASNSYLPPAEKPNEVETTEAPPPKASRVPPRKGSGKPAASRKPTSAAASKPAKLPGKGGSPIATDLRKRTKTTPGPTAGSIVDAYYPNGGRHESSAAPPPRPFLVYGPPERPAPDRRPHSSYVTSTPVPLRAYYGEYESVVPRLRFPERNAQTVTGIRPDFVQSARPNGKSVASFYFYEEPVSKAPAPVAGYYDGRGYYRAPNGDGQTVRDFAYDQPVDNGFGVSSDVEFRPIPSREPSPFFFVPQRQGSRTLTQEYFSVQKPKAQSDYVQRVVLPQRGAQGTFYEQIASIQQTIDYYTTDRPSPDVFRQNRHRENRQRPRPVPRPVYQFGFRGAEPESGRGAFRAPEMDSEPFRPMVTYSKPYDFEGDYGSGAKSTHSIDGRRPATESPQPSKYYATTPSRDYDYDAPSLSVKPVGKPSKLSVATKTNLAIPSPKPKKARPQNPTTKNPIDHAYYTKQEEGLFDDITKNYFTIFGQKIEQSDTDGIGIAATAPVRPIDVSTVRPAVDGAPGPSRRPPASLADDTRVNYRQPRPLVNPESEFVPIVDPEVRAKYEAEQHLKRLRERNSLQRQKVHSVEIIRSEPYERGVGEGRQFGTDQIDILDRGRVAEGRPGSLVAYRLPGEGAHVYFLTPQPARHDYRTPEEIASLS